MIELKDTERRTLQFVLDEVDRRIVRLERADAGILARAPARNPGPGYAWYSAEDGKIRVWNGSSYDSWSKD